MFADMKVRKTIDVEVPDLAERIAAARKASDLPMTQLAAKAGMSTANWYRLERGESKVVPLETLQAIEAALGVKLGVEF